MHRYGMIAVFLIFSLFASAGMATAGNYRTSYYPPQHSPRYVDHSFEAAIFGVVLGGLAATVLYESQRPRAVYYERCDFRPDRRHMHRHRHHDRRHDRRDRHDRGHDRGHGHR